MLVDSEFCGYLALEELPFTALRLEVFADRQRNRGQVASL
jgi:hypothetical protein